MNEKLQQCGVQLPLPNQCVSDDIISQAESHYCTQAFSPQRSKRRSTTVEGTGHLVSACCIRTSLWTHAAWKAPNLRGMRHLRIYFWVLFQRWLCCMTSVLKVHNSPTKAAYMCWNGTRDEIPLKWSVAKLSRALRQTCYCRGSTVIVCYVIFVLCTSSVERVISVSYQSGGQQLTGGYQVLSSRAGQGSTEERQQLLKGLVSSRAT